MTEAPQEDFHVLNILSDEELMAAVEIWRDLLDAAADRDDFDNTEEGATIRSVALNIAFKGRFPDAPDTAIDELVREVDRMMCLYVFGNTEIGQELGGNQPHQFEIMDNAYKNVLLRVLRGDCTVTSLDELIAELRIAVEDQGGMPPRMSSKEVASWMVDNLEELISGVCPDDKAEEAPQEDSHVLDVFSDEDLEAGVKVWEDLLETFRKEKSGTAQRLSLFGTNFITEFPHSTDAATGALFQEIERMMYLFTKANILIGPLDDVAREILLGVLKGDRIVTTTDELMAEAEKVAGKRVFSMLDDLCLVALSGADSDEEAEEVLAKEGSGLSREDRLRLKERFSDAVLEFLPDPDEEE